MVGNLLDVVIQRLEGTIALQNQIVSIEDRLTLEEMQTSLVSVLLVCDPFMITSIDFLLAIGSTE